MNQPQQRAAIILCGGLSSRMGYPKAWLPFGHETMLARVVRILEPLVAEMIVVAANDQELPPLSQPVCIARDERPARGPLEGLAAGLRCLSSTTTYAYVTSCDVPLLQPAFIERMFKEAIDYDIAVPLEEKFHHPLAAVYHASVLPRVQDLLANDQLRPIFLFDCCRTKRVPIDRLREVDPDLKTLRNLNHPADYLAAAEECGFEIPAELRQKWQA